MSAQLKKHKNIKTKQGAPKGMSGKIIHFSFSNAGLSSQGIHFKIIKNCHFCRLLNNTQLEQTKALSVLARSGVDYQRQKSTNKGTAY